MSTWKASDWCIATCGPATCSRTLHASSPVGHADVQSNQSQSRIGSQLKLFWQRPSYWCQQQAAQAQHGRLIFGFASPSQLRALRFQLRQDLQTGASMPGARLRGSDFWFEDPTRSPLSRTSEVPGISRANQATICTGEGISTASLWKNQLPAAFGGESTSSPEEVCFWHA